MFLRLLKYVELLPAIPSTSMLFTLQFVPIPGQAWRFAQSTSTLQTRGRCFVGHASFSSVQPRVNNQPLSGSGNGGLEANLGAAIVCTSVSPGTIVAASGLLTPFFELRADVTGAVPAGTAIELTMSVGVPIECIKVLQAVDGLPFAVGDDLANSAHGRVVAR